MTFSLFLQTVQSFRFIWVCHSYLSAEPNYRFDQTICVLNNHLFFNEILRKGADSILWSKLQITIHQCVQTWKRETPKYAQSQKEHEHVLLTMQDLGDKGYIPINATHYTPCTWRKCSVLRLKTIKESDIDSTMYMLVYVCVYIYIYMHIDTNLLLTVFSSKGKPL